MSGWSDEALDRAEARKKYMLGEAKHAVIQVLEENGLTTNGKVAVKKLIAEKAEEKVVANRSAGGYKYIPTVEGTNVREATKKFIR